MQQYFDEYVFDLKNNCKKFIVPKKLKLKERIELTKKYGNKDGNRFINWYSDYSELPYEQAVFYCQKENISWDIDIRKKYKGFLIIIAIILILGFIVNAIFQRTLVSSLLTVLLSIFPLASFMSSSITKLNRDIEKQLDLLQYMESIENVLNNVDIWNDIEELQVEIFNYRKKAYLIPNWFHKLFRKNLQEFADAYAKEICSKKGSTNESSNKE